MELLLVEKAKKHDREAFAELMRIHKKSMYKVSKAILKNDEDVADAMQDTILTCWEKISSLKSNDYFKTWLIRILINHCKAIYRQKKKVIPNESLPESIAATDEYANVEWMELLNCLDEKYRTVILLYYVEGFKVREIAQILELSESAIKGRMGTAKEKLERLYQSGKVRQMI